MPRGTNHRAKQNLVGYLFISPWLIGFITFTAWPFLRSIYLSFTRYNIITEPKWVGAANYRMLLTNDELFWKSAWVTIKYAMISVPLGIVEGCCATTTAAGLRTASARAVERALMMCTSGKNRVP